MGLAAFVLILLCFLVLAALAAGIGHFTARLMLQYRIGEDRIQFLLFGLLPLTQIKFRDIAYVRKASVDDIFRFGAMSLHNRLFCQWVIIFKNKGFCRTFLITPDNADEFIKLVAPFQREPTGEDA
jgi:hypothetical protein